MTMVRRGKESYQYVLPTLEADVAANEEGKKRAFLAPFFTNLDRDVYALTGKLPERIKAVLVARQSRAETRDARELLWQELVTAPELGLARLRETLETETEDFLDEEKAAKKIENIVDGFGDDSVREQASAYVMVQNASILATTFGFTHQLLTRIEASTRYINWGKQENGRYLYKELDFDENDEAKRVYQGAMELCFATYGELWQPVWDYVVATNPKEAGVSQAAYEAAVRGRVCDDLKGLLPLSALTNFGLHGNFRALSEQVIDLRASDIAEMRHLGDEIAAELKRINPEFIEMVDSRHGRVWTDAKREQEQHLKNEARFRNFSREGNKKPGIDLLRVSTRHFLFSLAKAYINSQDPGLDRGAVNREAERLVKSGQMELMLTTLGKMRSNRRHELPDFLRNVDMEIRFRQISFGSTKDLFRHRRILWRTQADFSGQNGAHLPKDIEAMGGKVRENYATVQKMMAAVVVWMREHAGEERARYCLTQGMLTTFDITCDLVEANWIAELRSIASGFEEYRWFAQALWRALLARYPDLMALNSFTDFSDYPLGRIREAVKADLAGRG